MKHICGQAGKLKVCGKCKHSVPHSRIEFDDSSHYWNDNVFIDESCSIFKDGDECYDKIGHGLFMVATPYCKRIK
jgi:hypothetical protein